MKEEMIIYYRWNSPEEPSKTHHEHGRYLLKQALKNECGIEFLEEMIEYQACGKPVLKHSALLFSISHCKGMAVCALSQAGIGVDVEGLRRVTDALIDRVCSEKEKQYVKECGPAHEALRFLRLWTLKESYLKMTGEGLRAPLHQVEFEIRKEPGAGIWILPNEIISSKEGSFWQIKLKKDYILSVCLETPKASSGLLKKEPVMKEM